MPYRWRDPLPPFESALGSEKVLAHDDMDNGGFAFLDASTASVLQVRTPMCVES